MVEFVTRRKHDSCLYCNKQKGASLLRDRHLLGALLSGNDHNHHNDDDDDGTHNRNDDSGSVRLGGPTAAAVIALVREGIAIDAEVLAVLVQNEDVRDLRASAVGRLQSRNRVLTALRDRTSIQLPTDEQSREMRTRRCRTCCPQ